jgi:hypothetical protein
MNEFDEFAKKLSAEHAKKSSEHEAQEKKARQERDELNRAGQAALLTQVAPLLNEASQACHAQGLRTEITNNWERELVMRPAFDFQVFGQKKRPFDESTYEVYGHKVSISHDGHELKASVSRSSVHTKTNQRYEGDGIEGAMEAIKIAIASLYEELSPNRS